MREFTDLQRVPGFRKYSDHPLGTLYMLLDSRGLPELMIRHFDRDLPERLVSAYAGVVRTAAKWIKDRSELARFVEVVRPVEVGKDFLARPFHTQHTSLNAYVEWDDPPEPPDELEEMRTALRSAIKEQVDEREAIIQRILERSLLEPNDETYFDEHDGKFIVVEPMLTRDDLERWDVTDT